MAVFEKWWLGKEADSGLCWRKGKGHQITFLCKLLGAGRSDGTTLFLPAVRKERVHFLLLDASHPLQAALYIWKKLFPAKICQKLGSWTSNRSWGAHGFISPPDTWEAERLLKWGRSLHSGPWDYDWPTYQRFERLIHMYVCQNDGKIRHVWIQRLHCRWFFAFGHWSLANKEIYHQHLHVLLAAD